MKAELKVVTHLSSGVTITVLPVGSDIHDGRDSVALVVVSTEVTTLVGGCGHGGRSSISSLLLTLHSDLFPPLFLAQSYQLRRSTTLLPIHGRLSRPLELAVQQAFNVDSRFFFPSDS